MEMGSNMRICKLNDDKNKILQYLKAGEILRQQLFKKYGEYHWVYVALMK